MGDGIINFANIGWLLLLGAFYYGAVQLQDGTVITPEKRAKIDTILKKLDGYPLPYLAVTVWIMLRVMFALGWQLQFELLLVVSACTYVYRQTERVRTKFAYSLQRQLTESDDPAAILGKNLPEWVTYPSANRVQWLNTTINSLWPSIVGATDTSIRQVLEPILEKNRPSFVYGFRIHSASIGTQPIVINGVQHHSYGVTETTLDISASWDAEMDIRLLVRVPGPDVEIIVKDFNLKMTMRLTLGPHIPQWPCVGNMQVSLVGVPEMDFNVTAGKVPLDSVPGLGDFMDTFIRETLVGMLAYPKGFVIPIVKGYKLETGLAAGALGTLKIKFLRMENLLPKFKKYKKTPFYVKVQINGDGKKRFRGASYTGFDSMMTDVFSFTLYDNTGSIRTWLYFDIPGKDTCIGVCDTPTKALMESKSDEDELMIMKPSDPSKKRRASLFVTAQFLPFVGKGGPDGNAPPEGLPPHHPTNEFLDKVDGTAPPIPSVRAETPRATNGPQDNSGTLFVTVRGASGLKNLEKLSKSDPYVFLRLNGSTAKSRYVNNNLNPTFNFDAELPVTDATKDILKVSLIDKNDSEADKLMAYLEMPLTTIQANKNSSLTGDFPLDPQGTVNITMNFLRHG